MNSIKEYLDKQHTVYLKDILGMLVLGLFSIIARASIRQNN